MFKFHINAQTSAAAVTELIIINSMLPDFNVATTCCKIAQAEGEKRFTFEAERVVTRQSSFFRSPVHPEIEAQFDSR